jgi:phage-related protein
MTMVLLMDLFLEKFLKMTERAQKNWDTYIQGYSKALMTPVEDFSTYMDDDIKKIIASVLRETVNQLQKGTTIGAVIMCADVLELCEELENL